MEIIEKEKVKEVEGMHRDINGKANAGLTLGIVGTALGAWNLFGGRRFPFLGGRGYGLDGANININGVSAGGHYGPTAFDAWEKGCEDTLSLQKGLYDWALVNQANRFNDRQVIDSELFGLYKSQVDADFGLYKSQRDSDDSIKKELSDLKTQVAINSAIRPYQDKLIQSEIDKAFTAGINYTDKKTCNVLYGQVVLPSKPEVVGFAGYDPCNCNVVEPK